MTPKEDAKELIDKFFTGKRLYDEINWQQAKECALICVDELIKMDFVYTGEDSEYWQEVKKELENDSN